MNPTRKQLLAGVGLVALSALLGTVAQRSPEWTMQLFMALGFAALAATLLGPGAGAAPVRLDGLPEAIRQAARGKRPLPPDDAPAAVAEAFDELGRLARRHGELAQEVARLEGSRGLDAEELASALARARAGERVRPPAGASAATARVYEEIARTGETGARTGVELEALEEAVRRARAGERFRPAAAPPRDAAEGQHGQGDLGEELAAARAEVKSRRGELAEVAAGLDDALRRMGDTVAAQLHATELSSRHVRELGKSLEELAHAIEMLATSAEESSSSILEMTATNDQVVENVGELAASVRDTVSSIEEMAYSIKEVAKNIDALSLTAEETSSSMNEMDVSIDQVQSNANETARLSEEVASDAEKGAEAILKTIGEIYRIKESSQEAVAVISNLGFRIEAIGQILAVIDDVAEQTNLLALNAAIIAAQAGEHGKGFAVVADEIKDLAERAGGSTKEIADLIKTIQLESKNAIAAVERGAHNVDRGVEVSNEAERALKKILESSQKSTNMVRAIARATVEQAKGSKQVTDAIGRIAETVQQIAGATAEQARGSEIIMKSAEKMRSVTQHVERSSQEQAKGGRQITQAIEHISGMVSNLNVTQRGQIRETEQILDASHRIEETAKLQESALRALMAAAERLRRLG